MYTDKLQMAIGHNSSWIFGSGSPTVHALFQFSKYKYT